ncbi:MAG TPA: phosphotransferase [Candidatus Limnocylindrales bacterium]|nr:phosphotransferase [Candidatus Limnocylindrales bacterium]
MPTQKQVVDALLTPEAYPEDPGKIKLVQTHISFVFLTRRFAYKVKKAVNFGFLDFSTLEKRRFFCEKELELNRRLCPEIYLEVVPINKSNLIRIEGNGETVEYALKMKRLPQDKIMTVLLRENKVKKKTINELAKIIARFHSMAQTNDKISSFGSLEIIKTNWDENFDQTKKYAGRTITEAEYSFLENKINNFIVTNKTLFESRIRNNRIRDCHGDLHSGNIFITDKICIFDAIEFNDRFRYSDVASDVAFLAMDLDFQKRPDLSEYVVDRYIAYSKDQELTNVLQFYKCYRAYVRGKVISFKLDDLDLNEKEKNDAAIQAQAYFKLAVEYAKKM